MNLLRWDICINNYYMPIIDSSQNSQNSQNMEQAKNQHKFVCFDCSTMPGYAPPIPILERSNARTKFKFENISVRCEHCNRSQTIKRLLPVAE